MRLAETYQATRDALERVAARALMKRPPRERAPWYLVPEGGSAPAGLTPETGLDDAIGTFASRTGRRLEATPTGIRTSVPSRRLS